MNKKTQTERFNIQWIDGYPLVTIDGFDKPKNPATRLLADGDGNTKTRKNVGYLSEGLSMARIS